MSAQKAVTEVLARSAISSEAQGCLSSSLVAGRIVFLGVIGRKSLFLAGCQVGANLSL